MRQAMRAMSFHRLQPTSLDAMSLSVSEGWLVLFTLHLPMTIRNYVSMGDFNFADSRTNANHNGRTKFS